MLYVKCLFVFILCNYSTLASIIYLRTESASKKTENLCATYDGEDGKIVEAEMFPEWLHEQNAMELRDPSKLCSKNWTALKLEVSSATIIVLHVNCSEVHRTKCLLCKEWIELRQKLYSVGIKTVILHRTLFSEKKISGGKNFIVNINDDYMLILGADKEPPRDGVPFQSPIRNLYFNSYSERYGTKDLKISPWIQTTNHKLRKFVAAFVVIFVSVITVFFGSRNGAKIGEKRYLEYLQKRKNYLAKKILKRAIEKQRIRKERGSKSTIKREKGQAIEAEKGASEADPTSNESNKKVEAEKMKKGKQPCEWLYVLMAFIIVVILAIFLVVIWFLREYIFDIFDVIFMLCSVSAMILVDLIVKKIPCGSKRIVIKQCHCHCGKKKVVVEPSSSSDLFENSEEKARYKMDKENCCTIEYRQLFGVFFCLCVGVVWYLFRLDYEWVWVLQMFLACCLVTACQAIFSNTIKPKFQYVVFLALGLLVYDIFMVHVTPYITGKKESIMEQVAVKPPTDTELPRYFAFALYFPDYFAGTVPACLGIRPAVLLGLGDLLIAAIIMEYIFLFGRVTGAGSRYEVACSLTYLVALIACYVTAILAESPQPALEFIVPMLLIIIFIIAGAHKEAKLLWNLDYSEYPSQEELVALVRSELVARKRAQDETAVKNENGPSVEKRVTDETENESSGAESSGSAETQHTLGEIQI